MATKNKAEKLNIQVTLPEAATICRSLLAIKKIPFLISAMGIGKTSIVRQLAEEMNAKFIHLLLAQKDAVDISGVPKITEKNTTVFCPPDELVPDGPALVLFDELPSAPRPTQVAGLQLMDPARTGLGGRLRDDTLMICAGNRSIDRTVINTLPAPLINRICPIHVRADLDAWIGYMVERKKGARVVSFLAENPASLMTFKSEDYDGEEGFGTPRSWEALAELDDEGLPRGLEVPAAGSVVGHAEALKFIGYLKVYSHLPKWEQILKDPEGARVPDDNPSACFAAATLVAIRSDKKSFEATSKYLCRLPGDRVVMALKFISQNRRDLLGSPGFLRAITKFKGLMLDAPEEKGKK